VDSFLTEAAMLRVRRRGCLEQILQIARSLPDIAFALGGSCVRKIG